MSQLSETPISRSHDSVVQMIADQRGFLHNVIRARLDARMSARLDVSDVVQEAQLEALRRLSKFLQRPSITLKHWLRMIAYDQVVMAQRKHLVAEKRSMKLESREIDNTVGGMDHIAGRDGTASEIIGKRHETERLRSAIRSLSNSDQQVIRLQVFEQLKSQDAASVLQISPSAVRKRLGRAIIRLRKSMSERNDGSNT